MAVNTIDKLQFLLCDAMLSAVYAVVVCLSVCVCVCLFVCHTPVLYQHGKRRIMKIMPHDTHGTLVFWHQSSQ